MRLNAVILVALVAGATVAADTVPAQRPNVLVVMWDTVRSDRLSTYGLNVATTPQLDTFSRRARVYQRAVSPSPWTLPAHAAIFTGLYPRTAGTGGTPGLERRFDTLAEILSRAGYATYLFSANPWVSNRSGLAQGFATAEYSWSDPWKTLIAQSTIRRLRDDPLQRQARERIDSPEKFIRGAFKEAGDYTGQAFLRWLDRRSGQQPFFAFLNYMEAHAPILSTRAERLPFADPAEVDFTYHWHTTPGGPDDRFAPRYRQAALSEYDSALHRLDRWFGELLNEIDKRGLSGRTMVIVVSDHGEALGEHTMYGHGQSVYRVLTAVPLAIRYPLRFPPGRVSRPVMTIDLFRTILDVAGVEPTMTAGLQSYSLCDAESRYPTDRLIVSERLPEAKKQKLKMMDVERAIELGDFRFIRRHGQPLALFDIARDPYETENLLDSHPLEVHTLGARLDAWVASTPKHTPGPAYAKTRHQLDPAVVERLRALGYLDGP